MRIRRLFVLGPVGLLALAPVCAADLQITGGSIGGNASSTPPQGQVGFACGGIPASNSSCASAGSGSPVLTCVNSAPGDSVNQSASATFGATGGDATTSGGLGDFGNPGSKASARGYVNVSSGGIDISMCGETSSGTGVGTAGTVGGDYSANVNIPSGLFRFHFDSPDGQPTPFTETFNGFALPVGHAFEPDLSSATPGAITHVGNQDLMATGDYYYSYNGFFGTAGTGTNARSFSKSYSLNIGAAPSNCCSPWDNGSPDGRGGQTSQISVDDDWRPLVNAAFDDFYLCPGQINIINSVSGRMNTNSALPKFLIAILPDCDGQPDIHHPVAVAGLAGTRWEVEQKDVPFILGRIFFADTGSPDADGYRPIDVAAIFDAKKLALKPGTYWTSIVGISGNLNPLDEFFWATSGNSVIKGRPGVFFDGDEFRTSDLLCCGCTDYSFCVQGETCKILLDNGTPEGFMGPLGSPSLQNGTRTSDRSRSADKVVFPPCTDFDPCFIEGWVYTNCDRVAIQFFHDNCGKCPDDNDPGTALIEADCVMATDITATTSPGEGSQVVTLKKVQFFFGHDTCAARCVASLMGFNRFNGYNLWVSLVGLGDNRQNARAYFAFGQRCDRPCTSFGPGCFRAAPISTTHWTKNTIYDAAGHGFDYALLVAVRDLAQVPGTTSQPACAADFNHADGVTVQDLFDFLAAWFTGCP